MFDGVKKAACFFAHTDDEMVCAGTLHRLVRQGVEVQVIAFGAAATKTDRKGGQASGEVVANEWHRSLDVIGVSHGRWCPWLTPSSELSKFSQDICQFIFDHCEREKPDLVFTLSPDDENTAHAVVGVECERVMRGRVPVTIRCQFPWNFSLGRPNLFVKLSEEDFEVKRKVIECYQSQAFRYDYSMLSDYCVADGKSLKCGPVEKFELIRGVV